jgi:hypothetical protein
MGIIKPGGSGRELPESAAALRDELARIGAEMIANGERVVQLAESIVPGENEDEQ